MKSRSPYIAAGCAILHALLVVPGARAQVAPAGNEIPADEIQRRLQRLDTSLAAAQDEIAALRQSVQDLTLQLRAAAPVGAANAETEDLAKTVALLREGEEVLAAQVKQHEQTKVESRSKFAVHLTGMVIVNTFANAGNVDVIDLPTSALRREPGASHGSVGGSLRQTWLGLQGRGPTLGRLRTFGRVDFDFFAAETYAATSSPAGTARLRTGSISAASDHDLFEARLDQPLISPLSPASLASVAQPALAWTGNLWTWAPELRWKHSFGSGEGRSLDVEAGLRDPYDAGIGSDPGSRLASPAEAARKPGYEGRVSFGRDAAASTGYGVYAPKTGDRWRLGGGGYYAKHDYGQSSLVKTWAVTADWDIRLLPTLQLSGEAYRGTGLGGLGGGAYRDVVQGTDRITGATRTIGLDAGGGWAQLSAQITPRLAWNSAFGQDAGSGSELRLLLLPAPASPASFYARNRAVMTNLMYRPWSSFVISPEYRFLQSWPISGTANGAHIFTLSLGYEF